MKRIVLFSLFALLGLSISSCADANKPEQLARVEALQNDIDSLYQLILDNPLDSAALMAQEAEIVERRIKNNYYTDTVNVEFARKMDKFKVMRKRLGPLGYDYLNLKNGCKEMQNSLKNLHNDIDNGFNERDKYDEFIQFEESKKKQLTLLANEYLEARQESLDTYENLFPELEAFSLMLVEKARNRQ